MNWISFYWKETDFFTTFICLHTFTFRVFPYIHSQFHYYISFCIFLFARPNFLHFHFLDLTCFFCIPHSNATKIRNIQTSFKACCILTSRLSSQTPNTLFLISFLYLPLESLSLWRKQHPPSPPPSFAYSFILFEMAFISIRSKRFRLKNIPTKGEQNTLVTFKSTL